MSAESHDARIRTPDASDAQQSDRRSALARLSSICMALGLVSGYGMFTALMGRFLYPSRVATKSWQFVRDLNSFTVGESLKYESPIGHQIVVTRMLDTGTADDFVALSSVCPHLGCQVHWESQNNRYFCPCHNGTFDAEGNPTGGPPKDDEQSLPRYPLMVKKGLLYIEVPLHRLV